MPLSERPSGPIDVLLVEDNPADARLLIESLKEAGADAFRVTHVTRLSTATELLGNGSTAAADIVLLDLSLPDSSGLPTVDRLHAAAPGVPVVVLTGLQDEKLALEAVRHGVQDYLVKGQFEGGIVARALRYAVERRRAEAALLESERRFRALSEATFDPLVLHESGRVLEINQAFVNAFGFKPEEVVGRDALKSFVAPESWGVMQEHIRSGSERPYEAMLLRRDGSRFLAEIRARNTVYRGRPVRVASIHDITNRKAAEEAVRRSEAELRAVLEHLPVGVTFHNTAGRVRFANPVAGRIWGGCLDADLRQNHQYTGWWADTNVRLGQHDWALARVLSAGQAVIGDVIDIQCFDGSRKTILSSAVPLRDARGDVSGAVVISEDVTERRRAELALRENEARLSAVVGTAVDAIITIDERGVIDSVNPATERLFGYRNEEVVGRNVSLLMPEPYRSEHDGYLDRYLRTGKARIIGIGRDVVGMRKDGSTFPLTLSVSEFHIGPRRMFTGIIHDISNRRRLEQEILEASANEQRRIGHELHDGICQQILGASFGMEVLAQRLEAGRATKEVASVRKLMDLLNDTLTQARALSHGLNPIDLRAGGLAKALADLAARVSDTFRIECRFHEDGQVELADSATSTHLFRIAQESISNAIKHGKPKRIEVRLNGTPDGWLTLTVSDNGKGIPAALPETEGRGLQIMQYRAALIGATVVIRPGKRGGTIVTCRLRVPPTAATPLVPVKAVPSRGWAGVPAPAAKPPAKKPARKPAAKLGARGTGMAGRRRQS
jgi:PAS domain S-box-containing protein